MRLVDQAPELALRHAECVLRVDLLDQRKLRRRQTRESEAAATRAQRYALTLGAHGDARLLRQRAENVEQFAARHRDVSRLLHVHRAGRHELHLQVGSRHAQAIIPRSEQHVGEHRHGLAALDHTDDTLERCEQVLAGGGQFHGNSLQ